MMCCLMSSSTAVLLGDDRLHNVLILRLETMMY